MPQLGPHISISDDQILTRVLHLTSDGSTPVTEEEFSQWPDDVQDLTRSLAAELFLVRYNPFIDQKLVKKSVKRRLNIARPALSGRYPVMLAESVDRFWERQEADNKFKEQLVAKLGEFLPEEAIGQRPNMLVESATDATDLRLELPMLVLFPETVGQIQKIVRLANQVGFSVIPRGGGTGLTGGAIPLQARTVILSLARFKQMLNVDKEGMTISAQAGVITLDAIKAAAKEGLLFTVDPASKAGSSLGGNISENSGGPFAFEYGTTIDNIYSYRMVTARGELIEVRRKDHPWHKVFEDETAVFEIFDAAGTQVDTIELAGEVIRKPGLGKDVSNKFLGGLPGVQKEGVDGIIVDCTFTCYPQVKHSRVLVLEFFGRSMRNAMHVINDVVGLRDTIREQGDLVKISALEEFGPKYVKAIEYETKSEQYEGSPISVLILQLDSDHLDALEEAVATIVAIATPYENVDVFAARDSKEAELFWEDRHKLSAISKRTSGFKINEDIVIPLAVIPEFSDFLENLNLIYLAKVYRQAILRIRELSEISIDEPKTDLALERCLAVLKGNITAHEVSDDELEMEVEYLFQELCDTYPRQERKLKKIHEDLKAKRIVIANHMHAGDGNCHVNLPVNSNDPEMLEQAHMAAGEVMERVLELNGEVTGEHGIGITKINYLAESKIDELKEYKKEVDPNNVLNPAKLTTRRLPAVPFTFSFNRLINDLEKTALKDKENLIELLRNVQTCTRCGKCKQVCPMYLPNRGLLFHPRNKNLSFGALIEAIYYSQVQLGEPDEKLLNRLRRLVEHCTACGKCTAVCPVKIDSAGAALQMRAFLEYKGKGGHPLKNRILHSLAEDPSKRLPKTAKFLSIAQLVGNRAVGLVPPRFKKRMTSPIFLSAGPSLDFKNLQQELKLEKGSFFRSPEAEETVFYFPGCGAGLFSRSIGMATLFLLNEAGVNIVMPRKHLCCGYPLLASGAQEAWKTNRHRTLQSIQDVIANAGVSSLHVSTVITACGTCREALETYNLDRELARPVEHKDAVQFLIERMEFPKATEEVLYHPACHIEWTGTSKAKAADMYRSALAKAVDGDVLLTPGCCGESGMGAITNPEIYNRLRDKKKLQLTADLTEKGKKTPVLVGCPSCKNGVRRSLMQLKKGNPVLHTVEFLAALVGGPKWKRTLKRKIDKAERFDDVVIMK
ncbi:MAG: FAD-binding and (Fe-S)-binding domain-containing protein [Desulfovibrio sp.]